MSAMNFPDSAIDDAEKVRNEWLERLSDLIVRVEGWARELDWSTRRTEKRMQDSRLGTYQAPLLLLQEGAARLMLEPIARFVPGAEGVVDLYLMPAYDDIASLYFKNGQWVMRYVFPAGSREESIHETEPVVLTKESFRSVLEAMSRNAA